MNTPAPPRFWTVLARSLRLRCPACGQGKMFSGYFRMNEACDRCQLKFQREAGYFLGAIYVNYGLTSVLLIVGYFTMFFATDLSDPAKLAIAGTFCVLFPLWFFRYARSLWRGLDQYLDPPEGKSSI